MCVWSPWFHPKLYIYPKYYKNFAYVLAHEMSLLYFSLFQFTILTQKGTLSSKSFKFSQFYERIKFFYAETAVYSES